MANPEEKLITIAEQLKKGVAPPMETVRTLLLWFDASRRGYNVCTAIKNMLNLYGLRTEPDFEEAYIDGQISFHRANTKAMVDGELSTDPTHRIVRLSSANRPPVRVNPDSTIEQVITLMLTNDFSQLPVMTSSREIKGVVSWKSIGSRLALKRPCGCARECMDTPRELSIDDSLFSAISIIVQYDYVLVRGRDNQICGIITASDLTEQFRRLAEPFLLVGEIEKGIRRILEGKFTKEDLNAVKLPEDNERAVEGVADLTFGEYIRLLESEKSWEKVNLTLDRTEFTKCLQQIREIRNDVMHFDPDGLDENDLKILREFSQFLKRLRDAGAA